MFASRTRLNRSWLLLMTLAAVPGCGQSARNAPSTTSGDRAGLRQEKKAVGVTVTDGAGYRDILKGHLGQVVLVDFWASW